MEAVAAPVGRTTAKDFEYRCVDDPKAFEAMLKELETESFDTSFDTLLRSYSGLLSTTQDTFSGGPRVVPPRPAV